MFKTLSGRFLILTIVFVMLVEVLIFVPSVSRYRQEYISSRLDLAQIASLALLADDMISVDLEKELLTNAGVYNVVLRRDKTRELILSSRLPNPVDRTFDMRNAGPFVLLKDAFMRLLRPEPEIIRVIGMPRLKAGSLIELTMDTTAMRQELLSFGFRVFLLSAFISISTAGLLMLVIRQSIIAPIKRIASHMKAFATSPEDTRNIMVPRSNILELRETEEGFSAMQTHLATALRQKERHAKLGQAVAKISHDLRNMLTTIQMLSDGLTLSDDPKVHRLTPKLMNNVTRAVAFTEGALAYGKAEEPAPKPALFDLDALICETLANEQSLACEKDIQFQKQVNISRPVFADQDQLQRVIGNLVRNAVQAIPSFGEVKVIAKDMANGWQIDVHDNGPGMPQKAQDHLFEAFQGRARTGGTGLGLAIAKEIIVGHGGNLTLHSTGDTGTIFRIILPDATEQETGA